MRTLLLATLLLACASSARACNCASPRSLSEAKNLSFAFVGNVPTVERKQTGELIEELVTFQVTENLTDVKGRTAQVLFRQGIAPCDRPEPKFKTGETYTISSHDRIDKNVLYNDFCDLRLKH